MKKISILIRWMSLSIAISLFGLSQGFRHSIPVHNRVDHDFVARRTTLWAKEGDDEVIQLIHSHHLLDHKPDNMILKGSKFKLRGVACLGRPSVGLCVGASKNIQKFCKKLKSAMPQKKFSTIDIVRTGDPVYFEGYDEISLGELRTVLVKLGHEEHFFAITGIDPSNAVDSSKSEAGSNNPQKHGGKKKKQKNRK